MLGKIDGRPFFIKSTLHIRYPVHCVQDRHLFFKLVKLCGSVMACMFN